MLQHVEAAGGGDLNLVFFQPIFLELEDLAALGADHVVVVLPQVMMLVADHPVVEAALASETETAQ